MPGLDLLATLAADPRVGDHYRLAAVRAHMHEMAGDSDAAVAEYLAASRRTASVPERDYLSAQAARLAVTRR